MRTCYNLFYSYLFLAEQPKGWFSWLRRGDSTPKPVTAKLGEENAFYFDKELGRWVNKKVFSFFNNVNQGLTVALGGC